MDSQLIFMGSYLPLGRSNSPSAWRIEVPDSKKQREKHFLTAFFFPRFLKRSVLTTTFPNKKHIWVFPKIGVPQNGWFLMENPIKMDDLGVPLFLETPISVNAKIPQREISKGSLLRPSLHFPMNLWSISCRHNFNIPKKSQNFALEALYTALKTNILNLTSPYWSGKSSAIHLHF